MMPPGPKYGEDSPAGFTLSVAPTVRTPAPLGQQPALGCRLGLPVWATAIVSFPVNVPV
jgi:hypothetical protein